MMTLGTVTIGVSMLTFELSYTLWLLHHRAGRELPMLMPRHVEVKVL